MPACDCRTVSVSVDCIRQGCSHEFVQVSPGAIMEVGKPSISNVCTGTEIHCQVQVCLVQGVK